jgi:hypothetical protein
VPDAGVALRGTAPFERGSREVVGNPELVRADAEGRLRVDVMPGVYTVRVALPGKGRGASLIPAVPGVEVSPGGSVTLDFHVRAGAVRLRALAPDGTTPLAGVSFILSAAGGSWSTSTPESSPDGWTTCDPAPVGELRVTAWPRHLRAPEARRAVADPRVLDAALLDLSSVTVATDLGEVVREVVREIVLPAGSGY